MMTTHDTTFGGTAAAVKLAEILTETNDAKSRRKVSSYLKNINGLMKSIDGIENLDHRRSLATMVLKSISECEMLLPEKVGTFMRNVAVGRVRRSLEVWEADEEWARTAFDVEFDDE